MLQNQQENDKTHQQTHVFWLLNLEKFVARIKKISELVRRKYNNLHLRWITKYKIMQQAKIQLPEKDHTTLKKIRLEIC